MWCWQKRKTLKTRVKGKGQTELRCIVHVFQFPTMSVVFMHWQYVLLNILKNKILSFRKCYLNGYRANYWDPSAPLSISGVHPSRGGVKVDFFSLRVLCHCRDEANISPTSNSSLGGHLVHFYLRKIIDRASKNNHVWVFVWTYIFLSLGRIHRDGIICNEVHA